MYMYVVHGHFQTISKIKTKSVYRVTFKQRSKQTNEYTMYLFTTYIKSTLNETNIHIDELQHVHTHIMLSKVSY